MEQDNSQDELHLLQRDKLIQSVNNLEQPLEGILLKLEEILQLLKNNTLSDNK